MRTRLRPVGKLDPLGHALIGLGYLKLKRQPLLEHLNAGVLNTGQVLDVYHLAGLH